ncbi:hypothetical protein N9O57_00035 [bacterium]|nr:hypothetical protein [bacterium]
MKTFLFFFISVLSLNSYSLDRFTCIQYDRDTQKALSGLITLEPIFSDKKFPNNSNKSLLRYILKRYDLNKSVLRPMLKTSGIVTTEDVDFLFKSNNQDLSFHIYLDEEAESTFNYTDHELSINISEDYICR